MPPEPNPLTAVPFHFWSVVYFVFGTMVGSFLNVCIHRMPLGQSIVTPRSHCPHCKYSIPWFLNIPLFTWLYLRGRCANCRAPISVRYFLVELLTGLLFLCAWLVDGRIDPLLPIPLCILLAGLVAATFIDLEHFIIPDEITIGGMFAGFLASWLVPSLQEAHNPVRAMKESFAGLLIGAGIIYAMLRLGKILFGRQRIKIPERSRIVFGESDLLLPDQAIPFEEIFYRRSDKIVFQAEKLEIVDRCYANVQVKLWQHRLLIGDDEFKPEDVHHLEAITSQVVLPREAMGLGDVKFMGAIGAFLGWPAVLFTLMVSAFLGSIFGVALILMKRREASGRIPYGPYIALATAIWIFGGGHAAEPYITGMASEFLRLFFSMFR